MVDLSPKQKEQQAFEDKLQIISRKAKKEPIEFPGLTDKESMIYIVGELLSWGVPRICKLFKITERRFYQILRTAKRKREVVKEDKERG